MPDLTADDLVRQVISAHQAEGMARAFEAAGRVFGFAARRARAYWHHEITDPRESECRRIRAAYAAWADLQLRRLDAERALLAARRAALWGSNEASHTTKDAPPREAARPIPLADAGLRLLERAAVAGD